MPFSRKSEFSGKLPSTFFSGVIHFDFVFVDEESFHKYKPTSFDGIMRSFREYKN